MAIVLIGFLVVGFLALVFVAVYSEINRSRRIDEAVRKSNELDRRGHLMGEIFDRKVRMSRNDFASWVASEDLLFCGLCGGTGRSTGGSCPAKCIEGVVIPKRR